MKARHYYYGENNLDITPKPRLLQMLGEIEFSEWQCIAELVDNAFDNFIEIHRAGKPWAGGYVVNVTLPDLGMTPEDAVVIVEDTGTGMSKTQLQDAVRAGFSTNDRYTKLGLFGMGFNVATARLGTKTTVLTTTSADSLWSGVEIDFSKLKDNFDAPEPSLPKEYMAAHGTRIEIANLKPDRFAYLRQHHAALRQTLGKVYGYLLAEYPFELYVQGERVNPVTHCVWDKSRSVSLKLAGASVTVPAQIEIDIPLTPVSVCSECDATNSQAFGETDPICPNCGSSNVKKMERRIWGWLGVQRFLNQTNFGVDFLRNGRKILLNDRRLFEWKSPDDPSVAAVLEYPRNLAHQGGRIVGEIHLDHIPVTYAKDAFEYSDRGWRLMLEKLHGEGPIHPKKAKEQGYPENESPVAQLVRAYDRTDAGTACLIPGDGKQAIHQTSRSWGDKFYAGDPEYQLDTIWWEAAQEHDRKSALPEVPAGNGGDATGTDIDGDDIWGDFDGVEDPAGTPEPVTVLPVQPKIVESVEQKLSKLRTSGRRNLGLTGDIHSPLTGLKASVSTFEVNFGGKLLDQNEKRTAILIQRGKGEEFEIFVDIQHPYISKFGKDVRDLVAAELARYFLAFANSTESFSSVLSEIVEKNAMFADSLETPARAKSLALDMAQSVREQLLSGDSKYLEKLLAALSVSDQEVIRDEMLSRTGVTRQIDSLEALEFAPPVTLLRLFALVPEAFFDGKVFDREYETIPSPDLRFKAQAVIQAFLTEVVMATGTAPLSSQQSRRVYLAVDALREALVQID